MAKGLGAMLAELEIAASMAKCNEGMLVLCPLCGEEMAYNGVVWYCNNPVHEEWLNDHSEAAYRYQKSGHPVFWRDLNTSRHNRYWDPEMQGLIIAMTETGWAFSTRRGGRGLTNFVVDSPDGWRHEDPETRCRPPALEDWKFAEWVDTNWRPRE